MPFFIFLGFAFRSILVVVSGDAAGVDLFALGNVCGELCEAARDVVATVANARAMREARNLRIKWVLWVNHPVVKIVPADRRECGLLV